MQLSKLKFPAKLEPYKGVIYFVTILMVSNLFWKYNILGDESLSLNSKVTFWGLDISSPFTWMANAIAKATISILNLFGSNVTLNTGNIFRHENGFAVQVVWACTGLKQAYIFFCIIAFYRGSWRKKIWFIPLGLIVVSLFNLFRIAFIIGIVGFYPDWFQFLHITLFKYLFYGVIFLMWVYWEEKFVLKSESTELNDTTEISNKPTTKK